jgi:hypothetical protein
MHPVGTPRSSVAQLEDVRVLLPHPAMDGYRCVVVVVVADDQVLGEAAVQTPSGFGDASQLPRRPLLGSSEGSATGSGKGGLIVASPDQEPPASSGKGGLSNDRYYENVDGVDVHSPAYSTEGSTPADATARCADGTYSFSQHRSGTCSSHGGVSQWLR